MLPTSRFSRSVSSRIVVSSSRLLLGLVPHRGVEQARHARLDRRQRRPQVVRDRGEHRRPELVRLGVELCGPRPGVQPRAVERRGGLLAAASSSSSSSRRERPLADGPLRLERAERHGADHQRAPPRRDHRRSRRARDATAWSWLPASSTVISHRREAEGLQQHRGELVEDAVGHLAGQAASWTGSRATGPHARGGTRARVPRRAAHQETHHHGHRQEHDGGHHLLGAVEAEPEPGRPIEEGQRHRGQQCRDQPAGQAARHRCDHDGQQEQSDRGGRPAPAQRDRGQPRYQRGPPRRSCRLGRSTPATADRSRCACSVHRATGGPGTMAFTRSSRGAHGSFTPPSRRPDDALGKELPILRILPGGPPDALQLGGSPGTVLFGVRSGPSPGAMPVLQTVR